MSYFPKGHHDTGDEVDDFDEYDPTPYGGGYNIELTYGRPLPPSEETCYANTSSASDDFDYDRPQYTSSAEPSAYGEDALDNEYKSYARPKPRPGANRPTEYGSGGGRPDYGRSESEYGSGGGGGGGGYGRKPEYGEQGSEYGSGGGGGGYGRKPQYGDEGSEYGSGGGGGGYGRKPQYGEEGSEYGSGGGGGGYGRKPQYGEQGSEYGSGDGGGYGRRPESESEYGSGGGYRRKQESESEYGSGGGYGRRPESESEYGSGGYGRRSEEESGGGYGRRPERSEYQSEGYERPSYGRSEEEDYRKPSYDRDDDEGGRKKYDGMVIILIWLLLFSVKYLNMDDVQGDDDESEGEDKRRRQHHRRQGQVSLCLSHVSIQRAWKRWLQSEIVVRCSPTSYSLRQMGQPPSAPSSLVHVSNTIPAVLSCLTGGAETELVPTKQKRLDILILYKMVNILLRLVWRQSVLDFNGTEFLHRRAVVTLVSYLKILLRGIRNSFKFVGGA
ncbi:hypothetical protein SASPL_139803 [Salvia splendens]|uniref:Uncharacterized protein n=1 Tax=Salvia splendens TaxID=180675 RepID=A0A8X8WPP9_SALSN|nr:hypothetical protein SASPL_139803 [Salvia splendens]